MIIESRENKLIKKLFKLKTKKGRAEFGEYVIEGIRSCVNVTAPVAIVADENYRGVCDVRVSNKLFRYLAETENPQGVLAIAKIPEISLTDIENNNGGKPVLILDSIRDPGNMGTIIRSALAFGIGGIIVPGGAVDVYGPKVVRSAMGAVEQVKIYRSPCLTDDIMRLKAAGRSVIAADLGGESLFETKLSGAPVFVIGNEYEGVSCDIIKLCDKSITIPMPGGTESLNAAVACSVILFEYLRQSRTVNS